MRTYQDAGFRASIFLMKWDVVVIRIGFLLLLAAVAFLINPLRSTAHVPASLGEDILTRKLLSAAVGAIVGA